MASADQYAAWIVANPDKKGTPQFDTVAAAYKAAKAGEGSPSLADSLGQGAAHVASSIANIPHAYMEGARWAGANPNKVKAIGDMAANVGGAVVHGTEDLGNALAGYMQQTRELSPGDQRGSAAAMNKAPAEGMERAVWNATGLNLSPESIAAALHGNFGPPNANAWATAKDQIANHPIATAAVLAGPAMKGVQALAPAVQATGAGTQIAAALDASPTLNRAKEIINAGKRSTEAVGGVRADATAQLLAQHQAQEAQAAAAASQAAAARASQATSEAAATPSALPIGAVTDLASQGDQLRSPIAAALEKTDAGFQAKDNELRPAVDAAVKAREDSGQSIGDQPDMQALQGELEARLRPPATAPTVTSVPKPDEGGNVLQGVLDTLRGHQAELSPEDAAKAKAAGIDVQEVAGAPNGDLPGQPRYFRQFKPTFEAVNNLGRRLGEKVYGQEPKGFEAIGVHEALPIYQRVQKALNAFAGPQRAEMQSNWEAKIANAKAFGKTRIGGAATGEIRGLDIPKAPSEAVANAAFSSRDSYLQARKLAGPAPARAALQNRVKTILTAPTGGPVPYAQAVKAVNDPSRPLKAIIDSEPSVRQAVNAHLTQLHDAEQAGVQAKAFGEQATAAQKVQAKAAEAAASYHAEMVAMDKLPSAKVPGAARALVTRLAKDGLISPADQARHLDAINNAEKTLGDKAARDKIRNYILTVAGVGTAAKAGVDVLHY